VITEVEGVRVGHWTDGAARTGCTVVLFPEGTVASGEVRGGAPATREFALLEPGRLVERIDAVVLSGGSAFGLAAADGVMAWCEERGIGFPTAAGPVPIVVGMSIFDLAVGDAAVRPGPAEGRAACDAAGPGPVAQGLIGAGTGATVDKWRGRDRARPGGVGTATARNGDLVVGALAVVNAFGGVLAPGADPDAGPDAGPGPEGPDRGSGPGGPPVLFGNTTVGVVATNAALDKVGCRSVAQGAHDGLARAIHPPHSSVDGDAVVAAATGSVPASTDLVRALAVTAFAAAIRAAVAPPARATGPGAGHPPRR
jgi:L-aminopeptidase/D-esterase-like protein